MCSARAGITRSLSSVVQQVVAGAQCEGCQRQTSFSRVSKREKERCIARLSLFPIELCRARAARLYGHWIANCVYRNRRRRRRRSRSFIEESVAVFLLHAWGFCFFFSVAGSEREVLRVGEREVWRFSVVTTRLCGWAGVDEFWRRTFREVWVIVFLRNFRVKQKKLTDVYSFFWVQRANKILRIMFLCAVVESFVYTRESRIYLNFTRPQNTGQNFF